MAQLPNAFNANDFDPTQSTGQLPVGKHPVVAIESEVKPTAANDGGMLVYTLQIIDGPSKGATGAYRLNLYNASPKAVEIAQRQFSAMCHATGVFNVQDSAQLHNIPFMVEVGVQKGSEQYTEVKKVFDANGNEPGKGGQQQAAQTHQPAQQQQQQQQAQGGWGAQPDQQQQQAPQQQQQGGWGQQPAQQQQAAPQQQQQQAPQQQQQQQAPWGQQQQAQGQQQAPWGQK